jgi:hypothetical protein
MQINPESRTVPCARLECEKLVQLSDMDYMAINNGKVVVVVCDCNKCFEVVGEVDDDIIVAHYKCSDCGNRTPCKLEVTTDGPGCCDPDGCTYGMGKATWIKVE